MYSLIYGQGFSPKRMTAAAGVWHYHRRAHHVDMLQALYLHSVCLQRIYGAVTQLQEITDLFICGRGGKFEGQYMTVRTTVEANRALLGLGLGLGVGLGQRPCLDPTGKCFPARKIIQHHHRKIPRPAVRGTLQQSTQRWW